MLNTEDRNKNCFNFIRIVACLQVMFGHLQHHLGIALPQPLPYFLNIFQGVPVFFILSGFLIHDSVKRTPDLKVFFNKRILRLYPELWICVLIELLSIYLFYQKSVPLNIYLIFGFTQSTLFQFWTPDILRDWGCGTPNGALWTIPIIVEFYILIWIIRKWLWKLSAQKAIVLVIITILLSFSYQLFSNKLPLLIAKLIGVSIAPYFWLFILGSLLSKYYNNLITLLKRYWVIALVLIIVFKYFHIEFKAGYNVPECICLALFIIGFAYSFPKIKIKYDFSYGIYIYHMIFVNIVLSMGLYANLLGYILAIILTFIFAIFSYFSIGKISVKRKQQLPI